ncbi:type IV toxin-antitoxin system AbiEi family antitoxin [Pseudidiomarina sp. 1APP75-32.1]|uniref:Type IV toxin-antitoxin system AbiEi family antitoxin n=1 Tax=Pseudidiomarina terrestris TaxID=2820060 RepID=A0AAW7R314_9GAMM|nr:MULTISPECIES: type IV toxin-antitoxin system AbiEi family antitoxin [unclassified Pseudidiomarina]MDN7125508.1 type IV toxin-antitoxin system AbiEi family antitoxin [Pseudidiomarina sp. 1APP75-32.1]MDN7130266.1 type IV toxin-antitoxin system AbiEi family antitoxin [Pseudidiomarina sp. 1APR75-15]
MSADISSKLNRLLSTQPSGIVLCSSWLVENGYSLDLQQRYKKSQWFESIGAGALIRYGDHVDYLGGLHAMQTQLDLSVHPGGKTALGLQGKAHYLEFSAKHAQLFGAQGEHVPLWFKKRDWSVDVKCTLSNFLPAEIGLTEITHKQFTVKVSDPARAIMECLYLAPKSQSLLEAYELMEGLNNLRPASVQKLLEVCNSVKVKRLFLYMADKANHAWMQYLDLSRVNLGTGKRAIVASGVYIAKYQITVPKELESME